jgi:hypothetical protein
MVMSILKQSRTIVESVGTHLSCDGGIEFQNKSDGSEIRPYRLEMPARRLS